MPERVGDVGDVVERLRPSTRVLITCHTSPDGDAIGSELGMAELVESLGCAASIVNRDPFPATLEFLPGHERIARSASLPADLTARFDLGIVLDCPGLDRTGWRGLDALPLVNIDHHLDNERYGVANLVDEGAAAVGELVLEVALAAGAALTPTLATSLYAALVTDTGDFRYSNTTPRALRAAATLVEAGADPHGIAQALWEHVPERVVRLTGAVLATLELRAGGRLAMIHCDRDMLAATGAGPADTEDVINHARGIDGVEVAVFLKAFAADTVKVSLRSRGATDVQAIARSFGGGGHREAAGCTLAMPLPAAREAMAAAVTAVLESA